MSANYAARHAIWCERLATVSRAPLALAPDFPAVARRWEAWWRFEADRPLLVAAVPKRLDIRWDKAFDLLEKPAEWLNVRRLQVENLHWVDATVPSIRVDLGPVVTGAFLGAPLHFAAAEQTSWESPIIEDWDDSAVPDPDPENHWLKVALALARVTAADAAGRYLVSMPDLSGAVDVLANMRGTERLLMDLYDHAEEVERAAERVVPAWKLAFAALYEEITAAGAAVTSWLHAWSDVPYTVPTCDFNFMLSPAQFRRFCLPSLVLQAQLAGRCLFHLDGPGASRHAEALAAEPAITAIQYTPGAGTPSALAKVEMLRMLQAARKPLVVCCPKSEVSALVDLLDHRGVVLIPEGIASPAEADDLVGLIER